MNQTELYKKLLLHIDQQITTALVTITDCGESNLIGVKLIITSNGQHYYQDTFPKKLIVPVLNHCTPLIDKKRSKTVTFKWQHTFVECYIEVYLAPSHLLIAGAGHICEPTAQIGSMIGFHVTVIDDRAEYANRKRFDFVNEVVCKPFLDYFKTVPLTPDTYILLLTRGHKYDVVCLQELLNRNEKPAYIGMVGSRRRISGVFEQLRNEFPEEAFSNIYTPVGLDIGAETPAEIAVSIMAELLKVKNNRSGTSLCETIPNLEKLRFRGGK